MSKRRPSVIALTFCWATTSATLYGATAERFESRDVPTIASLDADLAKRATLASRLNGQATHPCPDFAPLKAHQCVLEEGTSFITGAALPWILGSSIRSWNHASLQWLLSSEPLTEGSVWARADQVDSAERHLQEVKQLSGQLFGCSGITCLTITEVFSPATPEVRAWAICELGAQRAKVPRFCVPVLAQIKDVTVLRAWSYFSAEGGEGRPDFKAYLVLPALKTAPEVPFALSRGLGAAPWSMDVDASPSVILASSARRASSVDRSVREEPTVRIDISQGEAFSTQLNDKVRYVKVMASTTIYVNELNTTQNEDWHLPSAEFQKRYVMALHLFVQRTLGEVCPAIQWLDGQRGACGFPESSFPALLEVSLP